jgi:hypothetical protein
MKHAIIAACGAFGIAGTLTLSAQTPPTPPRPQTPQPSATTPSRTDERTTTLSGCLKAWDATTNSPATGAATPGATTGAGTAAAAKFVLTNVQADTMTSSGGSTAKPESTTPGAAGASAETKQYVLTADSGVNLAAHLNHQVRVTGKASAMADHSAMGTARPGETTRPGEMTKPGTTPPSRPSTDHDNMGKAWPTMTVTSVTMISATCTGATR